MTIAVLHPGAMGSAVAAQLVAAGHRCAWLPTGRGEATRRRAGEAGLVPLAELGELEACEVVLSVCPPAAAPAVAAEVARTGFRGRYVEANAISPRHSAEIAALLAPRGVTVVDGGIVGPPPRKPGTTRIYLSGPESDAVAALFTTTALQPRVLPGNVGAASALKLAFATYNKVGTVLAAQAHSLARHHGVSAELTELATAFAPSTPLANPGSLVGAAGKAWRWSPEMREIADACRDSGLPADLLAAAESFLDHWRTYKDDPTPTLDDLLAALTLPANSTAGDDHVVVPSGE
jgi:3-hydroxyisobutyrate dehydrogenase-like beta-hydroxyacid dehydrogenase